MICQLTHPLSPSSLSCQLILTFNPLLILSIFFDHNIVMSQQIMLCIVTVVTVFAFELDNPRLIYLEVGKYSHFNSPG